MSPTETIPPEDREEEKQHQEAIVEHKKSFHFIEGNTII